MTANGRQYAKPSPEEHLAALPFWSGLGGMEKEQLLAAAEPRCYAARESIRDAATDCRGLLLVTDGYIRSYIGSEGGREVTLFLTTPGKACLSPAHDGKTGVFQNIQAVTACSLIYINHAAWQKLTGESLPVSRFTLETVSAHIESVLRVMESQLFSPIESRIASLLVLLSELGGTEALSLTHSEIALHLGTAREVVSRVLEALCRAGLLENRRGRIRILNLEALRGVIRGL